MNICLSSDDNYAQHLGVTIKSLLNTQQDFLQIYILDSGITEDNKNKIISMIKPDRAEIIFYPINEDLFNNYQLDKHTYVTAAMFNRFKIPELLPKKDRVLYLDVDIVVLKDLHSFYNTNMNGNALGMIQDWSGPHRAFKLGITRYYNSGVMLFDIKKCLKENLFNRLMNGLKNNQMFLACPDQDIINMHCQDIIKQFDFIYNAQIHPDLTDNVQNIKSQISNIAILHYTTKYKPWSGESNCFEKYYMNILRQTPWKTQENLIKHKKMIKQLRKFIFAFEKKNNIKKYKILQIPIFAKKRVDNLRIFYLFGVPIFSISENIKYDWRNNR